jgi:hypothetical protein
MEEGTNAKSGSVIGKTTTAIEMSKEVPESLPLFGAGIDPLSFSLIRPGGLNPGQMKDVDSPTSLRYHVPAQQMFSLREGSAS